MGAPDLDALGGWPVVLRALAEGHDVPAEQAGAAMTEILAGRATDARIAAFIVALRMKGEAVDEISGMVDAMLAASSPLELGVDAVDIVGTGGSASRRVRALNVSTMACFVVAGAGVPVCKHGNRRASSTSGSFDLLEALGVTIDLDGEGVARCVREAGVGFAFARAFHPAMRFAGPVRAELGIPTVFNVLGPLSHPGGVTRQVIGVGDERMAPRVAGVLARRGVARALVVRGRDGLDEITLTGPTTIHEVRDGELRSYDIAPADVGLPERTPDELGGGDAAANAVLAHRCFAGERGAVRDIVAVNAAAGLLVGGAVETLADGVVLAGEVLDDGRAAAALERVVTLSAHLAG
ncbi:MAG TPA: anthranilate phosphoribosyltransferase [Acidimicrobiales bacterium]|nr:anthranilate phosphoribosyltransferase [Acidimicrobiales bacterium]